MTTLSNQQRRTPMPTETTPEEIMQMCDALEAQQFGLFPWLKNAQAIADFSRRQKQELKQCEQRIQDLKREIASFTAQRDTISDTVAKKTEAEFNAGRKLIDLELRDATQRLADEQARLAT